MSLSKHSVETLLDLVEIKLSCFEVWDREDRRELKALQACRSELLQACGRPAPAPATGAVVAFGARGKARAAVG